METHLDVNFVPWNSLENLELGSLDVEDQVVHRWVTKGKEDRVQREALDSDGSSSKRGVQAHSLLIELSLVRSSVLLFLLVHFAGRFDIFLGVDYATCKAPVSTSYTYFTFVKLT